jgi:hypothetical protein
MEDKTDCAVCTGEKVVGEDNVCINCGATDGQPTERFAQVLAADAPNEPTHTREEMVEMMGEEGVAKLEAEAEEEESPKVDGGDEEVQSSNGSEADQVTDAVAE